MRGSCVIDGTDIATLGAFILRGGDYDFLSFPARKEPLQNNWFERDGVEADLSEIYFNEKPLSVGFHLMGNDGEDFAEKLNEFYTMLSSPGYHSLYSREFDKTFLLRFVRITEYLHTGGMYKAGQKSANITVEFSMDEPLQLFTQPGIMMPRNGRRSSTSVKINDIDLSEFGVIVKQCYNTVLALATPKAPLVRTFENRTGAMAHFAPRTTFDKKQIVIECTMTAASREDFYCNYEALWNNLTIKEAVKVSTFTDNDTRCYYTGMQNFEKMRPFGSGIMVSFGLVLTQLNTGINELVLGAENSQVITANNINMIKIYK